MRALWSCIVSAVLWLACAGGVLAQGTIVQSGPVTNFHVGAWFSNGVLADGGTVAAPFISNLGLFNGANCPFGVSSQTGPGVSTAPYGLFTICQTAAATTLTVMGENGDPTPAFYINIGGTIYPFPGGGPYCLLSGCTITGNFGVQGFFNLPINLDAPGTSVFQSTNNPTVAEFQYNGAGVNLGYIRLDTLSAAGSLLNHNYYFTNSAGQDVGAIDNYVVDNPTPGSERGEWKVGVAAPGVAMIGAGGIVSGSQIGNGGSLYAVHDRITLVNSNGSSSTNDPVMLEVETESGGTVTSAAIVDAGLFPGTVPTAFTQASTSGSGTGFILSQPIYAAGQYPQFAFDLAAGASGGGLLSTYMGYSIGVQGKTVINGGANAQGVPASVIPGAYTFAQLSAFGNVATGALATVTDSTVTGGVIAGGGTNVVTALWNGSAWVAQGGGCNGAVADGTCYIGAGALASYAPGVGLTQDTALGVGAMGSSTAANSTTAVGFDAGANAGGRASVFIGHVAGEYVGEGPSNTAVGAFALQDQMANGQGQTGAVMPAYFLAGGNNVAMGEAAGLYACCQAAGNDGVGFNANFANLDGISNNALGDDALEVNAHQSFNTALGHGAGRYTMLGDSACGGAFSCYGPTGVGTTSTASITVSPTSTSTIVPLVSVAGMSVGDPVDWTTFGVPFGIISAVTANTSITTGNNVFTTVTSPTYCLTYSGTTACPVPGPGITSDPMIDASDANSGKQWTFGDTSWLPQTTYSFETNPGLIQAVLLVHSLTALVDTCSTVPQVQLFGSPSTGQVTTVLPYFSGAGCSIGDTFTMSPSYLAANTYWTGTASITGTTLTTSATTGGAVVAGQFLTGSGVTAGTKIVSGSGSTWQVSISQSVGSESMGAADFVLTMTATGTGEVVTSSGGFSGNAHVLSYNALPAGLIDTGATGTVNLDTSVSGTCSTGAGGCVDAGTILTDTRTGFSYATSSGPSSGGNVWTFQDTAPFQVNDPVYARQPYSGTPVMYDMPTITNISGSSVTVSAGNTVGGAGVIFTDIAGVPYTYDATAWGYKALGSITGATSGNSAFGAKALAADTTGTDNAADGDNALILLTTGNADAGFGYNAGSFLTTGSHDTLLGASTGAHLTTASGDLLIGYGADDLSNTGNIMQMVGTSGAFISATGINTPSTSATTVAGSLAINGATRLAITTVAALPTCNTGAKGELYEVTDASSPTWHGTLTGGSTTFSGAMCNGSNWIAF